MLFPPSCDGKSTLFSELARPIERAVAVVGTSRRPVVQVARAVLTTLALVLREQVARAVLTTLALVRREQVARAVLTTLALVLRELRSEAVCPTLVHLVHLVHLVQLVRRGTLLEHRYLEPLERLDPSSYP